MSLKEIIDATRYVFTVLAGALGLALFGGFVGYLINHLAPAGITVLATDNSPVMAQEELHMIVCGTVAGLCIGFVSLARRK